MGNSIITPVKNFLNKFNPFQEDDLEIGEVSDCEVLPFRFVERSAWNPKKPKYRQVLKTPVDNYLLRYFTNTDGCKGDEECFERLQELQDEHMAQGLPDIAYNFLVGEDGTVYEGRGWTTKPTKMDFQAMKLNGKSIDIALIGDFKSLYPHSSVDEAVCRLMRKGVELGHCTEGWTLTEYRDDIPCGHWSRDDFGIDTDPKIYDETTEPEPPPCLPVEEPPAEAPLPAPQDDPPVPPPPLSEPPEA